MEAILAPAHHYSPPPVQQIFYGAGTLGEITAALDKQQCRRVLLVTFRSAPNHEITSVLSESIGERLAGAFSAVVPHSPLPAIFECAEQASEVNCDCIISFGGGSVIDHCKAVAFVLANDIRNPAELEQHLGQYAGQTAVRSKTKNLITHISVPTTGSAAEFTGIAGVTDPAKNRKFLIVDDKIAPSIVIHDPDATESTPQRLWLSSLVRSIDHAAEALYGPNRSPYSKLLAEEGLRLLSTQLPVSCEDPRNLEAREALMRGAWFSIWAVLQAGVGLSHGLGYILGGTYGVPHGECSCATLPAVLDWNAGHAPAEVAATARALGVASPDSDDTFAAALAGEGLRKLLKSLELPSRLSDLPQLAENDLSEIAELMLDMPHVHTNPRRADGVDDIRAFLQTAW